VRSVNFMPAYRTDAHTRRRRIGRWLRWGGTYLVLLGGLYAWSHSTWGGQTVSFAAAEQLAGRRVQVQTRLIETTRAELAAATRKLDANRVLKDLPDWSILLAALANSLNEYVVLDHCALTPLDESGRQATGTPDAHGAYELLISGYANTVQAASDLAVALERTRAFDQVRLLGTNQRPYVSGSAFHFRIRCTLGQAGEDRP
jgi:hypothetical protein